MTNILLHDYAFVIHGHAVNVIAHTVVCFSIQLELSSSEEDTPLDISDTLLIQQPHSAIAVL